MDDSTLIIHLKNYADSIRIDYFSNETSRKPINDRNENLINFCIILESILSNKFKGIESGERDYSEFLFKGIFNANINHNITEHKALRYIESCPELISSVNRGNLLIRYCLVNNALTQLLDKCFSNENFCREYYSDALINQKHYASSVISILSNLNDVEFDLSQPKELIYDSSLIKCSNVHTPDCDNTMDKDIVNEFLETKVMRLEMENAYEQSSKIFERNEIGIQTENDSNINSNNNLICKLSEEFEFLLKDSRNFNSHLFMLKKLLKLKERQKSDDDYSEIIKIKDAFESSNESNESNDTVIENENGNIYKKSNEQLLADLRSKFIELRDELNSSHLLTSCLVYNLQRLKRELTGSAVNQESAEEILNRLRKEHSKIRTSEAIFKYELQEKRKALNKYRYRLESTREEWKNMRVKSVENESEENDMSIKTPPESTDSAFHSECDMPLSNSSNDDSHGRRRIDLLEEQCQLLFTNLIQSAHRSESMDERLNLMFVENNNLYDTGDDDEDDEPISLNEEDDENLQGIDELDDGRVNDDGLTIDITTDATESNDIISDLPWDLNTIEASDTIGNRRLSSNSLQSFHEEINDVPTLANLRRKALETIVSRLKDERHMFEGKEQIFKEQIERLLLENQKLCQEIDHLKKENAKIVSKDNDFRKRAEYIFRHERDNFDCRLTQLYESKSQLQVTIGILETKLSEKEKEIQSVKEDLEMCRHELTSVKTLLENEIRVLKERINRDTELYERLLINFRESELQMSSLKERLSSKEEISLEFEDAIMGLKDARFMEQERFWQQIEEAEAHQHVRDEECAIFSKEITKTRKVQDHDRNEIMQLKACVEQTKDKSRELLQSQCQQLNALRDDNEMIRKKIIKLAKDKDLLWKKTMELLNDQCVLISGRWMNDKDANNCIQCNCKFTFTVRKHHCRICGGIFCNGCSNNWIMTSFLKKLSRVCNGCYSRQRQIDSSQTLESLLLSINSEDSTFIDSIEQSLSSPTQSPPPHLPAFLYPLPNVSSCTKFDVIEDEEIARSLSMCSPYNTYDCDAVDNNRADEEMQMSLTRYGREIESFGENGIEGEIWISPLSKYGFPILIDSFHKIIFEFNSFPSMIDFSVHFKKNMENDKSELTIKEHPVNAIEVTRKEFCATDSGAYIIVINNCYAKYIATKLKYRLCTEH